MNGRECLPSLLLPLSNAEPAVPCVKGIVLSPFSAAAKEWTQMYANGA